MSANVDITVTQPYEAPAPSQAYPSYGQQQSPMVYPAPQQYGQPMPQGAVIVAIPSAPPQMLMMNSFPTNQVPALASVKRKEFNDNCLIMDRYDFYPNDENGQHHQNNPLNDYGGQNAHASIREDNDFVQVCCVPLQCRGYKLRLISNKIPNHVEMSAEKECQCTLFWCNEAEMQLFDSAHRPAGMIKDNFHCCEANMSIRNPAGQEEFVLQSDRCQPGYQCPMPCGPCKQVDIPVYHAGSDRIAASVIKKNTCCSMLIDSDAYSIGFQDVSDPRARSAILQAIVLADKIHFADYDRKKNRNGHGRHHGHHNHH